ncbi:MAG: hypothetical protein U5O39_04315 [Gammaproteobacteria bacterium]|nr:hypothetical protein [Gammaproteobacteria bacterium]
MKVVIEFRRTLGPPVFGLRIQIDRHINEPTGTDQFRAMRTNADR